MAKPENPPAGERRAALVPLLKAVARALGADRGRHSYELVFVDGEPVEIMQRIPSVKLTRSQLELIVVPIDPDLVTS